MKHSVLIAAITLIFLCGCASVGPGTVTRDRFDYNKAIADSWKEQTLLNIVRLRYSDMPMFMEVASVLSGYTFQGTVNLGGVLHDSDSILGNTLNLGTNGTYADRPTITYAPITGDEFNRLFMTPMPPKLILSLMEFGWSSEMVLPMVTDAINGLRNRKAAGKYAREADTGYYRVISLFQEFQNSGNFNMRVVRTKDEKETTVLLIYRQDLSAELKASLKELEQLLGLQPGSRELMVTYGVMPEAKNEIALQTLSMLQIMVNLSLGIEVPQKHIEDGLTIPTLYRTAEELKEMGQRIKIHAAVDKPEQPFVCVKYKDHWFWIDDGDFYSKRVFTFMMIMFSLTESGSKQGLPLVTIPSG